MFGHVINLNFNRKGSSHNTIIGGIISILIKITIAIYVYLMLKKLILNEDVTIGLQYYALNLDELEPTVLN